MESKQTENMRLGLSLNGTSPGRCDADGPERTPAIGAAENCVSAHIPGPSTSGREQPPSVEVQQSLLGLETPHNMPDGLHPFGGRVSRHFGNSVGTSACIIPR